MKVEKRKGWLLNSVFVLLIWASPVFAFCTLSDAPSCPTLTEMTNKMDKIAAAHPDWAKVITYGKTVQDRAMRVLEIKRAMVSSRQKRPVVLITGLIHADEYLGVEDRFAGWFLENKEKSPGLKRFFEANGILLIIPVFNPDGYAVYKHENANGVNLNRDFDLPPLQEHNFKENETRLWASWLDTFLSKEEGVLKLTVDYHCCGAFIIPPWGYDDVPLPVVDQPRYDKIRKIFLQDFGSGYKYTPVAHAHGLSKDYYYGKYGSLSFTFEGARNEYANFETQTRWWDHLLSHVSQ